MRKGLTAVVVATLPLIAAPASADTLETISAGDVATCARDAGPGRLTLQGPLAGGRSPVDLLSASPERVKRLAGVDLGRLVSCPEVASGGGSIAVAGIVGQGGGARLSLRVAVRDAEAAFAEPQTIAAVSDGGSPALAVGPRGDAVVAWREIRLGGRDQSARVLAARRPAGPGARWGPPEEVVPWRTEAAFENDGDVAAGVDGQGRATVAWTADTPDAARISDLFELGAATAAPGQPLRSARVARLQGPDELALAVAPDGAAVLAVPADQTLRAFERPAGGGAFVPSAPLDRSFEGEGTHAAVALDPSGAALVAWSIDDYEYEARPRTRVLAARRPAGGRFGPPVSVWSRRIAVGNDTASAEISTIGSPLEERALRATLAADGRAAIAWVETRGVDGDLVPAGYLATGGPDERYTVTAVGSPCRPVNALTPFAGEDGDLLAAWTDNATERLTDEYEIPREAGRLHVADVGSAPAGPPSAPPRVQAAAPPGTQRLWAAQAAELTVACDGPCDLRAFVPGERGPVNAGGTALASPGRKRLRLYGAFGPIARRRPRSVPVVVHACAPDGTSRSRTTIRVRVVLRKPPPVPAPLGVRATPTAGGNVIVTWHTAFPARRAAFLVVGQPRRGDVPPSSYSFVEGRNHTSFSTVLPGMPGRAITRVRVEPYSLEGVRAPRGVDVPVGR